MTDYKNMYFNLYGKLADTIETLTDLADTLKKFQCELEESFIENSDEYRDD